MRIVAAVMLASGCTPLEGPRLDAIEPAAALRGQTVIVVGASFCGPERAAADGQCSSLPSGTVDFGLEPPIARAQVLSWRDDAIGVLVPASVDTGATTVYVTVDGRSSNGVTFEVLP